MLQVCSLPSMPIPRIASARAIALSFLLLVAGCAQLPERPALDHEAALPAGVGTELDRLVGPASEKHPGQSAFRLVGQGPEAFAIRAHAARLAGRSIDVQTYIWHGDTTGQAMAQVLLLAADRGVKVRLLLDDMDARAKNAGLAALDVHPNIAVRMFNPLPSRSGTLAFMGDFLGDAKRLNRRMHNKTWIVDNRLAVVGGRNLGDEYFGANEEVNFVDLDFALAGPIVQDASVSFDRYWNSSSTYPIALLNGGAAAGEDALASLRTQLVQSLEEAKRGSYAELLRRDDAVARLVQGDWPMTWSSDYRFVSDDPAKVQKATDASSSDVLAALAPVMRAAQQDLTIVSPYFVPRDGGTEGLVSIAKAGRRVRVLTNSLAANDVAAVHGAYSEYREPLLEGGVQLWELKPLPGVQTRTSFFGRGGASLHTKGLAVDGRTLFVGSYNLDPRSTALNCEQGVLVKNEELARQFMALFDLQTAGERAWKVSLDEGQLAWSDGKATHGEEPEATAGRKFQAWLAKLLPVEGQL